MIALSAHKCVLRKGGLYLLHYRLRVWRIPDTERNAISRPCVNWVLKLSLGTKYRCLPIDLSF